VDWNTANERCSNIYIDQDDHSSSSFLVSIHDQIEQDFLLGQLGKVRDGLNRWTGLHEDPETKQFYWSDNTLFDFSLWNWREPINSTLVSLIEPGDGDMFDLFSFYFIPAGVRANVRRYCKGGSVERRVMHE
jgi:hypothetical protein